MFDEQKLLNTKQFVFQPKVAMDDVISELKSI